MHGALSIVSVLVIIFYPTSSTLFKFKFISARWVVTGSGLKFKLKCYTESADNRSFYLVFTKVYDVIKEVDS